MKKMLINATKPEEIRVAIVRDGTLYDLDLEIPSKNLKKGNIYKGRITRIEPSLEAVFVDYGSERHGFLPFKEIAPAYLNFEKAAQMQKNELSEEDESDAELDGVEDPEKAKALIDNFFDELDNDDDDENIEDSELLVPKKREAASSETPSNVNIKELIYEGQEIIVQVEREERGQKGAALSTYISLAGRYLVLMPNNPRSAGISRRIEGEERDSLKSIVDALSLPTGMGLIVRTACLGKSQEDLQWDLDYLKKLWEAILDAVKVQEAPFLVYQESNLIIRAFRDYLRRDIDEVIIDEKDFYEHALEFTRLVIPHYSHIVKLYEGKTPLFTQYQIESEVERVYSRQIRLNSGGSLVIDYTEAMVSVDVNSSKATKGGDIEETALNTNIEAAHELARQLRLRDVGGLIVIDFIDMLSDKHQREVEQALKNATQDDRARIQIGRISRFGLLEMSRQRLKSSIGESSLVACPRCDGVGLIREAESFAISVLRLIEEQAVRDKTKEVHAELPVAVATFLLNEKRADLAEIEKRDNIAIVITPNINMVTPHYQISRVTQKSPQPQASYRKNQTTTVEELSIARKTAQSKPAVTGIKPEQKQETPEPGLLKKLWSSFFGASTTATESEPVQKSTTRRPGGGNVHRRRGPRRHHNNGGNRKDPTQQTTTTAVATQATSGQVTTQATDGTTTERTANRGSRGGRRRHHSGNNRRRHHNKSNQDSTKERETV